MSDQWDVYLTQVNNNRIFVRLDMGIRNEVPVNDANKLVIVKIQTKSLFSKKLDFKLLSDIEDEFNIQLTEMDFFIGAVTGADFRTFYIYTKQEQVLNKMLERTLSKNKKLKFEISIEDDPNWKFYLETLYPNIFENQWIQDRNVVEQLKANNDNLQIPREICHWLNFKDFESRETFKRNLNTNVYKCVKEEAHDEESEFQFQLLISHTSTVELEAIYQYTTDLLNKVIEVGGDYEGWETPVMNNK
ncbi:DUF695 domain-containing protein [Paenibacillus sp. Leaf72]|uniref:DUF695 domain-containing protein n=1 Tax=Paenibacillus sp. Leaf72 TaxID=1736234 RepID=UPI0006F8F533|nr:DUF695 domain-containing protein [Paenibacillus sp. Leaf72]KQN98977.1 hypothetical protein ASF12_19525 [Paenibacillus sp. Leaf72]